MKAIFRNSILLITSIIIISCDDELNVNQNENNPTNVSARFFLTAAEASLATVLGGELTNYGGFLAQYHTQSPDGRQYLNIENYNVGSNYANDIWLEAYAGGINDLDKVIDLSQGNTGNVLIAHCLRVYYFQLLTDLFGDIPYAEKLSSLSNLNPLPIPQQKIYQRLINELQTAVNNYEANEIAPDFGSQDIFLDNNIGSWLRFANTLLLKLNLRLSETSDANPTAINALLTNNKFLETNVAFDIYEDEDKKRNPFNDEQIVSLNDVNHISSNSLLKFLQLNNDARINAIYRPNNIGDFNGIDQGARDLVEGSAKSILNFSRPNISATQPVYLFTEAEISFMQAEALVRYQGGAGAQEKYETGIRQSFDFSLQAIEEAEILINGAYSYNPRSSDENKIEKIIVQKWVANAYVNTIESYFEQLRTGFPKIVSKNANPDYRLGRLKVSLESVLQDNQTPLSLFYSQDEVNRNFNINQKATLLENVWWDPIILK